MANPTLEEMETHFNIVASDRSIVFVYSDDRVMQRKIEAVGATLVKEEQGGGKHYTLPANQLSLRRPMIKRSFTLEEKAAQVLRGQKLAQHRRKPVE